MKEKKIYALNKTVAKRIKIDAENWIFRTTFLKYIIIWVRSKISFMAF